MKRLPIQRLTSEAVVQLARGVVQGQIYLDYFQDSNSLAVRWLPTITWSGIPKRELQRLGGAYEYYDRALPRTINGLPCFASMRLLHVNDRKRVYDQIVEFEEALGITS